MMIDLNQYSCWKWLAAFFLLFLIQQQAHAAFDPGHASMPVQCQGRWLHYDIESVMVLPGEILCIQCPEAVEQDIVVTGEQGQVLAGEGKATWTWRAPMQPGLWHLVIQKSSTCETIQLQIWVLARFDPRSERTIGTYRIGRYPGADSVGSGRYPLPKGLIKLTRENRMIRVSPHFTLGQFACKQTATFPQYLLLDPALIDKCEQVLAQLNEDGYACRTLTVMSGFRTPFYNRQLGNVQYSSHLWGRAADIYVDEDLDGMMDDLNHDGACDESDAEILYRIIDRLDCHGPSGPVIGGLGLYTANRHHGPFVHLDVRGQKARWGIAVQELRQAAK